MPLLIVMPCSVDILGGPLFSEGKWRSSGYGGGECRGRLGGVEGGEGVVGMHCMRE